MGSCWNLVHTFVPDRQLSNLGKVCLPLDVRWNLVETYFQIGGNSIWEEFPLVTLLDG